MRIIEWLIKKLVSAYYNKTQFLTWSWSIDAETDISIISSEYHDDYYRVGLSERRYGDDD